MKVHPVVFWTSAALIALFVIVGAVFNEPLGRVLDLLQDRIVEQFGWFYIASVAGFFLFVIWLFFSRYSKVKLGKDNDEPEFSYATWFAMLFSAGMGIGLLFFSVAEPMMHFANPPQGMAAGTVEAARQAMTITFFHWGVHAWAIYIIIAAALAYFSFRHDLPLSIRSALYPLIGRHMYGTAGNIVDILAVFGTLFGLATSLGLGIMQINAGLERLGVLSISTANQVGLIAVITVAATISAATGLERGVRRLSELNLSLAGLLLLFVLITGPTIFLLSSFVSNVGRYASSLVDLTFRTDAFIGLEWQKNWTMFYWAWWISWSPFVGMFIARISRGRTLREFIGGVILVPTTLTFFWLTVFGNSALYMELFQGVPLAAATAANLSTAIFELLDQLPLVILSAPLAVAVVTIFFITSADSGALVIDTITSADHPERSSYQRIGWSITVGLVAAILLITGGLSALQTAAIITAVPFCLVMIVICVGLVKGLRAEVGTMDPFISLAQRLERLAQYSPIPLKSVLGPLAARAPGVVGPTLKSDAPWNERLRMLMEKVAEGRRVEPSVGHANRTVSSFIDETVVPAFNEIAEELKKYDREVLIENDDREASLIVLYDGQEEFAYGIYAHVYSRAHTAFPKIPEPGGGELVEKAEVVLRTGRHKEYEIRNWTKEGIIQEFLESYVKWMGW
ncbi:MAG: BCCT family transporter [Halioglobus sp.]|nr:BCCT family transporter [Halioglobus sp.]